MKYRTGYTTGVFDLFHIGHLNIIRRSSALCEKLIVGVTTDELCLQVKRRTPVIPFQERLEIVRSLRYVHQATAQMSMNKLQAWEEHRFDVMFVGSDWQGTPQWNALEIEFRKLNVDIVYFNYTQSTSSTILRSFLTDALART